MLTPDELAVLAAPAESIQMQLQRDTCRRIAEIIARHGYLTASGQHLINRLQVARFDVAYQADIAKYAKMTDAEIERIIRAAAEASHGYDKAIFERHGIPFIPFSENTFMQNLTQSAVNLAQSEWKSITQTRGFMVRRADGKLHATETAEFFRQELDRVTMSITAGTQTHAQAIRQAVVTMKNSGLRSVDYASGVHNRVDVAVRRAVLTGVTKVALEQAEEHSRQLGTTFFEITWHSGHRPSHGWGGRRFSSAPTNVIDIQTGRPFLTAEQLFAKYGGGILGEWNCRHNKFPVDEFTPPIYSDTDLSQKEQAENEITEYKGKGYTPYEATQRMREMEREMRALRLEGMMYKAQYQELRETASAAELTELENPYTEARLKYRTLRAEYENFAEAMNQNTQYERVSADTLGRVF